MFNYDRDLQPVSALVLVALSGLDECRHKGFAFPYEKGRAVRTLRALWHTADETFDPYAIEEWALEFGFRVSDAKKLRQFAERVREGCGLRDDGGLIHRDPERERKVVDHWRAKLANDD